MLRELLEGTYFVNTMLAQSWSMGTTIVLHKRRTAEYAFSLGRQNIVVNNCICYAVHIVENGRT